MTEWLTYRLSDFLMFEPETYFRLFELLNATLWPLGVVTMAAGLGMLTLSWRGESRIASPALLAVVWLVVAYVFHYRRYSTIMLAGKWFASMFVVEGVLLAIWARGSRSAARSEVNRAGVALALAGLLAWPLIPTLMGRSWKSAELFGLAPDPTAVVTLGLILTTRGPKLLLVIPLLWCVMSWATLSAMGSAEAWLVAGAGLVAVAVTVGQWIGRGTVDPSLRSG